MDPVVSTFAIIAGLASVVLVLLAQTEIIKVPPYMSAYIFKKGQRVRILPSGTYRIWKWGKVIQYVDPRPFWVQVQGQELTTKDGAPIRVSVSVHLNVVNPEAMAQASSISNDIYAYVQLKLRDHVVSRTMEQVTEERQTINSALGEALTPLLAKWGLEINEIAIRDITLLGESKKAYAELVNAQLRAKASMERARGEAAAMRSLLNTAELVRKNPELIHLRALQGMESGLAKVEIHLKEPPKGEADSST